MSQNISSIKFGNYTNIGKIQTDAWKSKENANDCYWNIAKNQAGENASNDEIAQVMNELIELNASKSNASGEYNTTLEANQEILLNLEATIKQADEGIQEASSSLETAHKEFSTSTTKLSTANSKYNNALESYQEAVAQGDEEKISSAYNALQEALNEVNNAKEEIKTKQENLAQAQENINELKEALNELKEEYRAKQSTNLELQNEFNKKIQDFETQIQTKQKEITSLKESAQKEIQKTPNSIKEAVKSIDNNIQKPSVEAPVEKETDEEKETKEEQPAKTKEDLANDLKSQFNSVQEEQGAVGKFWNGIKNICHTKYSSNKIEKAIEEFENGTKSYEEVSNIISEYQSRQKSGVNTVASVTSGLCVAVGVALAIPTGGSSIAVGLAAGAAIGGASRVGLKTLDRATNNVKGDAVDLKEMTKDGIIGTVEGLVTVATMGTATVGAKAAQEGGKVIVKEAIKQGAIAGVKTGAVSGATTNAATYMADVVTGDEEFSAKELASTTVEGGIAGGVTGGVMGGIGAGVGAVRTNAKADKLIQETLEAQQKAAQEFSETTLSAKDLITEGFEEKVADGQITSLDDALNFYSEKKLKESGLYDLLDDGINANVIDEDIIALDGAYYKDGTTGEVYQLKLKDEGGFEQIKIDPSSNEYKTAMKNIQGSSKPTVDVNDDLIDIDELCREKGNGGKTLPKEYINNQTDVRNHFKNAINSGDYLENPQTYKDTIDKAHKLAFSGADGDNLYYQHKGVLIDAQEANPGVIRSEGRLSSNYKKYAAEVEQIAQKYSDPYSTSQGMSVIKLEGIPETNLPRNYGTQHFYPSGGDDLACYYNQMYKTAKETMGLIEKGAEKNDILASIAKHYQYAANARPYEHINNSVFMNEVNTMLKKAGLDGMPQGILDHAAQRLQPESFIQYFIDFYNSNNLGLHNAA